MSAVPVLAKLAIPMGVGLLFLVSRKGKASASPGESQKKAKGVSLTKRAVTAMQGNKASDLDSVIQAFESEGDPTTASGLRFQFARMTARGGAGFSAVPTFDKDAVLGINNREWAPRLIQLEGRHKAVSAWAEAYRSIGATNLAKDLEEKAKFLQDLTKPADDGEKPSDKADDKFTAVIARVTAALATLDPAKMREEADRLEDEGFKEQADALRKAADELEEEARKRADPKTPPQPDIKVPVEPEPSKPGITFRTYTVRKGDSEFKIAKGFTGNGNRFPELVKLNVPKDGDGRKRTLITASNRQALGEPAERVGGLHPGLQPGQKLILPDSWLDAKDRPAPTPKPEPELRPASGVTLPSSTDAIIRHLPGKTPGKEDAVLVKRFQTDSKRTVDGKYGMGDALHIANTFGAVPPTPLYWPKKDTAKALKTWQQEMARLALQHPDKAEGFRFAAAAGKQPGFNAPSNSKVISRLLGDGFGPA